MAAIPIPPLFLPSPPDAVRHPQVRRSATRSDTRRKQRATARAKSGNEAGLASAAVGLALFEEVDEYVVAEGVGGGEEGAAAVHLHHALHEILEVGDSSSMKVLIVMPACVQR